MDCRNHSMEFARAAAEVCAANGIHVRIFPSLHPTPELSFAVRHYGCQAGINITASHNPKEYNGYKVYWEDGAQLPPQHADAIAKADGPRSTSSPAFMMRLRRGRPTAASR
jgi:phosphoglucomutase